MNKQFLLFFFIQLILTVYTKEAIALLEGTKGNSQISGKISFMTLSDNKTIVTGTVTGLVANSIHGFHVHEFGDLSKEDGTATGGHWNPFGGVHGFLEGTNSHAGDLGNVTADGQGIATVNITSSKISLSGVTSAVGKGLILHELFDDGVSQPTGNAGKRFAQGVIGIKNVANNKATSEQNSFAVCEFKGVQSTIFGRILFTQNADNTVKVQAFVCGLPLNSQHGFHVHEFGDLTGTDRTTNTGGHWNPTGTNHAYPPSTSRHYGDMGNITADSNGVAAFDKTFDLLTLNGVNSILGRGIVIHEKADDGQGATGNAGNKLGSCTIGYVSALPALQTFCPILQLTSKATSLLVGTSDNTGISGKVEFDYDGSKTTISGSITGLAANSIHGFHIHEFGDLSKDDGTATGGHWNPYGGVHSFLTDTNRHAGDLGNVTADGQGTATINIITDKVSLSGDVSAVGKGLILHELFDDGVSQPTGNAGKRFAQGVIGIKNIANNNATSEKNSFAVCEFKGINSTIYGRILFTQNADNTVKVDALICGLEKNSQHGFHVHEFGDLTGIDRTTNTGGHWNPTGANHAYPPSTSRHYGDMGNITVNDGGLATFMKSFDLLTLNGVNSIVGRAVVLHEKADDGQGATGNAGNKLGTCTIGYVSTLPALPSTCVFRTSSMSSQNAISFVFIFISALILLVY